MKLYYEIYINVYLIRPIRLKPETEAFQTIIKYLNLHIHTIKSTFVLQKKEKKTY